MNVDFKTLTKFEKKVVCYVITFIITGIVALVLNIYFTGPVVSFLSCFAWAVSVAFLIKFWFSREE